MMNRRELSYDKLVEWLDCDPGAGVLRWKKSNRGLTGRVAGSRHSSGYITVMIEGQFYLAHRLIWLYVHGAWPVHQTDHINGVKTDNRIGNLRDVLAAVNQQNRGPQSGTRLQSPGVDVNQGRFRARIMANGVRHELGRFDVLEDAQQAYRIAKQHFHPEAARPS